MSNTTTASSGIGFGGLLAILFIGLKLTNHITWSWVWVLSPLWIPLGFAATFLMFFMILTAVVALVHTLRQ